MAQPARGLTPAQQRERRSKILAIGSSVVFVIVLAIQAPKLLHRSHKTTAVTAAPVASSSSSILTAAPAAARAAAAATEASSAVPTLDGETAAPVAATMTLPTISASAQLSTFHLFPNKNPFKPQVAATGTSGGSPSGTSSSSSTSTSGSRASSSGTQSRSSLAAAASAAAAAASARAAAPKPPASTNTKAKTVTFKPKRKPKPSPPNAAIISTNGTQQLIPIGVDFPLQAPLFKLVSLNKQAIKIGVIGGSFTSGAPTLPVKPGQKLTLANESNGSRYVVKLVKIVAASEAEINSVMNALDGRKSQSSASSAPATTTSAATTTTTGGTPPTAPAAPATSPSNLTAGTRKP